MVVREKARTRLYQEPGKDGHSGRDVRRKRKSERTSCRMFGETTGLEIVKRIDGSSVRIRKMNFRTLWRGRPPPIRKKSLLAALE
jgi:hypothetical protein